MISEFDPYELKKLGVFPSEALAQAIDTMPGEAIKQALKQIQPFQETIHPFQEMTRPFQEMTRPFQEMTRPFQEMTRPFQEMTRPFASLAAERNNRIRELLTPLPRDSALSSLTKISAATKAPWLKSLGTPIPRDSPFFHGAFAPIPARFRNWLSEPSGEPSEEQERDIDGAERSVDTAIRSQNAQIRVIEDHSDSSADSYHAYGCQTLRSLCAAELKLNLPIANSVCGEMLPYDDSSCFRLSTEQVVELLTRSKNVLSSHAKEGLIVFREKGARFVYDTAYSPAILKAEEHFRSLLPYAGAMTSSEALFLGAVALLESIADAPEPKSLRGLKKLLDYIRLIADICRLFDK